VIARTSPIVALAVRTITPIALLIAVYVLFAGHNRPGGGFAAGLLLGAVIVLRTVAGLQEPRHARLYLVVGGIIVGAESIAPLFWGDDLLDQVVVSWTVPVLGTVKTGTALIFDIGVLAVVVGLVLALLDGFDARTLVERDRRSHSLQAVSPDGPDGAATEELP
jgi:multicomponent Na+:H+ antiporter subunit A